MKLTGFGLVSLIKRAAGRGVGLSWFESTINMQDSMSSTYSTRDSKMWELVPRMLGVVDHCITYNTNACVSVPLRLYRVVDESSAKERRRYPGRKSTPTRRKRIGEIKSGKMGIKAAMLANLGGEVEEVSDHPILDFIHRPNPIFPGMTLSQMRFRNKWGFGEHYDYIENGPDGMPLKAWPLYPQFTRIQFSNDNGYIEAFCYGRDQSHPKKYDPKDVIFYKHRPALHHPLRGESPMASMLPQLDIIYKNLMHDIAFVNGGNRPDSLVTIKDPNATEKHIKEVEARIKRLASGGIASVKAFVTRDVDWKPLSWAPKDLNTAEKLDRMERHVRTGYGHTESMADSTDTNVASAVIGFNAQFMGGTIHPALINDAAELTEFLIPRFGYSHGEYFLAYDNPVQTDAEKESRMVLAEIAGGKITINEGRERTGEARLPIPEADDLRVNGVKLGVLDAGPSADPANPLAALFSGARASGGSGDDTDDAPPDDPNMTAPDLGAGDDPEEKAIVLDDAGKKNVRAMIAAMLMDAKYADESVPCGCCTKDAGYTGDDDFDQIIRDRFPAIYGSMVDTLGDMQAEVANAIARGSDPDVSKQTQVLADLLLESFEPIVRQMAESTVSELAAAGLDVPSTGEDFTPTQAINAYKEHVSLVAEDIAKYTEELIKPAIERGLDSGLPIGDVISEIENADIPEWRAERITRTEIAEATNGGRYETMGELGVKQVRVVNAPSPSEAHAIIAARSPKNIGENFVEAGETIGKETFKYARKHPPFRPNCRCRIEPVL